MSVHQLYPRRAVPLRLVSGGGHHQSILPAVAAAHTSVWISTANLKEVMVDPALLGLEPGRGRNRYRSSLELFDALAARGVELRLLHARLPSRAFCDAFDRHPRLVRGGLDLRLCPRVHFKVVVVDGALLYLGSANWTGAAVGARAPARRNFELGLLSEDPTLLDQVQGMYDAIWSGSQCKECKLRDRCECPLDTL